MNERGYLLLDVAFKIDHHDQDLAVRCQEYLRQNIRSIIPTVPDEYEFDLIASGTAHNHDKCVFIGMHIPQGSKEISSDLADQVVKAVGRWASQISTDYIVKLSSTVAAPTWVDLCNTLHTYPKRK